MICRQSRVDMSVNVLNPITTQVHQKYQSIANLTALHIQQFHTSECITNHKLLKVTNSQIPISLSISHMFKLGELQKKERQTEGITIESFDVIKKE